MHILNEHPDLDTFFTQLGAATHRLLMLDYDGTLAPFTVRRDRAVPYDAILPILQQLVANRRCRTVIVSGRAIEDLTALLHLDPMPELWGSHGWERLHAGGAYESLPLDTRTAAVLHEEWDWLRSHFVAESIERKPTSVALHWRGSEQSARLSLQHRISARWKQLPDAAAVELHRFDGGLELRAGGRSKADVVHDLLGEYELPPTAAYLGDDMTDEEAFAALEGHGLRVLVRGESRPTRADLHLVPPEELRFFLEHWHRQLQ